LESEDLKIVSYNVKQLGQSLLSIRSWNWRHILAEFEKQR